MRKHRTRDTKKRIAQNAQRQAQMTVFG